MRTGSCKLKTDRLVNTLNRRLEERFPLNVPPDSQSGIVTIWKGKRIVSLEEWSKITGTRLDDDKVVFDINKGFDFFPDHLNQLVFQLCFEGPNEYLKEIPNEEFDAWLKDYIELLVFKRDQGFGNMLCGGCLLNPFKDQSGLRIGLHKIVAKLLQKELNVNQPLDLNQGDGYSRLQNNREDPVVYPCNVLNYFCCPYECKGQRKRFEHEFDTDIQYLFELDRITRLVDSALLKASYMTQSNETIYEIDANKDIFREIQTLYSGMQYCVDEWSIDKEGLKRILKQSAVSVRNKEDVLGVLKDRNKLDLLLKQYLTEKEQIEVKERILRYFEKNGKDLEISSYYKYTVYENKDKRTCLECGCAANIHLIKSDSWFCESHYHFHI